MDTSLRERVSQSVRLPTGSDVFAQLATRLLSSTDLLQVVTITCYHRLAIQ